MCNAAAGVVASSFRNNTHAAAGYVMKAVIAFLPLSRGSCCLLLTLWF